MITKEIYPKAAALFTRKTEIGVDYDWLVISGDKTLFDMAVSIHRHLMADVSGANLKTSLFKEDDRVALLVSDMATVRADAMERTIYNTLFLEFQADQYTDAIDIFRTIISEDEPQTAMKSLYDYSENLFKSNSTTLPPPALEISFNDALHSKSPSPMKGAWVLPSNEYSPEEELGKMLPFVKKQKVNFAVVLTGRVGLDKIQQFYSKVTLPENFIVFSNSVSVRKKKKLSSSDSVINSFTGKIVAATSLIVIFAIVFIWTFIPGGKKKHEKKVLPNNQIESNEIMQDQNRPREFISEKFDNSVEAKNLPEGLTSNLKSPVIWFEVIRFLKNFSANTSTTPTEKNEIESASGRGVSLGANKK